MLGGGHGDLATRPKLGVALTRRNLAGQMSAVLAECGGDQRIGATSVERAADPFPIGRNAREPMPR